MLGDHDVHEGLKEAPRFELKVEVKVAIPAITEVSRAVGITCYSYSSNRHHLKYDA
jgi:hypothetical protein